MLGKIEVKFPKKLISCISDIHTRKKCLGLAILRFVLFPCHRCSFWSWQERNHASVLSGKKRAMQFAILPPLTFLNTQLCHTGLLYHLFILHPAQRGLNLGYSPKAHYCRHLALTSHSALPDAVCSTPKCRILPQTTVGSLLQAQHMVSSQPCCCSRKKGCCVNGGKRAETTSCKYLGHITTESLWELFLYYVTEIWKTIPCSNSSK